MANRTQTSRVAGEYRWGGFPATNVALQLWMARWRARRYGDGSTVTLNDGENVIPPSVVISLPVRRLPVMLPRRRHLAWFGYGCRVGFLLSSVGKVRTARNKPTASGYYADEKTYRFSLRLLLLLSAAGLSFAAQAEERALGATG